MAKSVLHTIEDNLSTFSKGQKRIGRYILDHYDQAAFMTASKLGKLTEVSESTVVRFAAELGFDGYPSMQKALQEMARNRLTSTQRIQAAENIYDRDVLSSVLQADIENLRQISMDEDRDTFQTAVEKIVHARHIYILGARSSTHLAGYLYFYMQMIFENVTLVGVLSADISLYVDNYRAAERTFNLLTQVIGRAGRGSKAGRAVIQTYTPQNDVIQAAAQQDYQRFYDAEIQLRRLRRDPPFSDQFTVTVTGQEEDAVRQAIALLTRSLRQAAQQPPYSAMELQVLGPAPASVVKVNGSYRYRTMVLGRNDRQLRQLLAAFMREFAQRGENRRLHIYTDCNLMD